VLKNAYFLEKDVKDCLSVDGSAPERPLVSGGWGLRSKTPALLLPPTIITLSSSFLALNTLYCLQKRTILASSKFLQLFFTSNSVVFVGRGRKNISFPRAQGACVLFFVLMFK